ncbi:MAG: DMT family transporter [Fimbriimonadaceae bacterium]|nr:DMT family transporter [Fimbriimonadaceae bacterium]
MGKSLLLPGAFLLGLVIAGQLAINAGVATQTGNLRLNNAVFWSSGAIAAVLLGLTSRDPAFWSRAAQIPWWLWTAGVLGAVIVVGIAFLMQRLGAGATNVLMLSGQVVGSLLVSHYGLLGTPTDKLNPTRVVACAVMLLGAIVAVSGGRPAPER